MSGRWISRNGRLEALLDEAFDLDPEARERFVDTVEPELREDLARLLKADVASCPLDETLFDLEFIRSGQGGPYATRIEAGQQAGSYRLLRLIGEGGMATVWLAERTDNSFSHQVAVKCLKTGLATPESRARFLLEQQIMARLQHPYIARLYDAGVSGDNVPFIVMEWIEGVSLTRYCDERRMGVTQRLQLFLKVCSAVAHAHQNLIVHRDLKPANIMVGSDGEPRLLDFGIAKLLDESAPVTRTGMHMLTPEYAAPEQFRIGAITTATDGFMLGAVLYELLCGLRPRHFSRPGAIADATIVAPSEALRRAAGNGAVPTDALHPTQLAAQRDQSPERLRKTLRGDLDTIVLKALQAEPDRRYATVQAFSDDIERYLKHQPISARRDARMYRAGKFVRRHAMGLAIGTGVALALLIATTVSVYQARRAQTEATRALATKEFLTNLLEVSDAGMPRDQMPTTQTLLQDGATRIRGEFADAPDVKVDLLLTLGRIQLHLGQYASAEPLIKEALAIAQARFPPASVLWLQAQTEWAEVLREQSHLEQSAQLLGAAIDTHRRAGAIDSDALSQALTELSVIDSRVERFDRAIATARQSLDMARRLHGERHPQTQEALENLSKVLQRAGQPEEAETVARANLALSGTLYGEHKARYAGSLNVLAFVLEDQGKDVESERLARQALAIEESVYDRPNAALTETLAALNGSLYDQDKIYESESVLQRWLAAQTQIKGADDPTTTPVLMNMALDAERLHQYPQAEHLFRRALAIYAARPGSVPHAMQADAWRSLADTLIPQQRLPEAASAVQQAIRIDEAAFGNNSQRFGVDLDEQARVEMEQGRLQPALEHVDASLNNLARSMAAEGPDLFEARIEKAAILDRLSHHREASDLLASLVPLLRHVGSEYADRDRLARSLAELGRAQIGNGETYAALASWDEALKLQQAIQPADTDAIAGLQRSMASARH